MSNVNGDLCLHMSLDCDHAHAAHDINVMIVLVPMCFANCDWNPSELTTGIS